MKNILERFNYNDQFNEMVRQVEPIFLVKNYTAKKVRALYVNITLDGDEKKRYAENKPCRLPVKVGLCTWDMELNPGVRGMYSSYKVKRGRNTGFAMDMWTVMLYPFNKWFNQKIDCLVIRLIESIHMDMGYEVECTLDRTWDDDVRQQHCGSEFIQYGIIQEFVKWTVFIVYSIEENVFTDEYAEIVNRLSVRSKSIIDKIGNVLNTNQETDESIDKFIEGVDAQFRLYVDSTYYNGIDNTLLFKYLPREWNLNKNTLFYSFDEFTLRSAINRMKECGYIENATIVAIIDKYQEEKDIIIDVIKVKYKKEYTSEDMREERGKIDCLVINPPYHGDMFHDFLVNGYRMLSERGKMMFICPASFLNDQRFGSKSKKNIKLRKMIEPSVVKVIIDNFNPAFNVRNNHPFAIIYIDRAKVGNEIEFWSNGTKTVVTDINECNINGDCQLQRSIQAKCMNRKPEALSGSRLIKYKDKTISDRLSDKYFVAFNEIISSVVSNANCNNDNCNTDGVFYSYLECYMHHNYPRLMTFAEAKKYKDIATKNKQRRKNGQKVTEDGLNWFYYGTKDEMENWIYNTQNLKIFKAFSIIRFYDQHNQVCRESPLLLDRRYTDDEVYRDFGISQEEQDYIDALLCQYDMKGEWFQRYIRGTNTVESYKIL